MAEKKKETEKEDKKDSKKDKVFQIPISEKNENWLKETRKKDKGKGKDKKDKKDTKETKDKKDDKKSKKASNDLMGLIDRFMNQ